MEKPLCWCNVIVGLQATITQDGSHTFSIPDASNTHVIHPKVFDLAFSFVGAA
jgi:hypothetical protein